jgi:hypothetical protein
MFGWITKIFDRSNDPVYSCDLYRDIEAGSCAHVDGPLCDFPICSMLAEYRESKEGITINNADKFHQELKEMMEEQKRNRSPVPFA